jgi:hypothetical protein
MKDAILEKIGYSIEGKFDHVEIITGAVYITHGDETYVISLEKIM